MLANGFSQSERQIEKERVFLRELDLLFEAIRGEGERIAF